MRSVIIALGAGLALIACKAYAADGLTGPAWLVESVKGAGTIDTAQTSFTMQAGGNVVTTLGCNQFSGKATVYGTKLTFGALASTRKACAEALMDQEQKYAEALAAVRSYRLEGQFLKLRDNADVDLITLARAR